MSLTERSILVADTSFSGQAAAEWCARLSAIAPSYWPAAAPKFDPVSAQWLLGRMESKTTGRVRAASVLLIVDDHTTASFVDRFMQGMMANSLGGVCLSPAHRKWQDIQQDGVLFEPQDAPEGKIAAMLYAISERQTAVDLLSTELELANRCQEGVRLEIERLHEELNLAASLQREFTSAPLPEAEGLGFSVLFRPVNFVSGDVYAVRQLDAEHLGFLVADAVGHGVPAALLTMVLTNCLSSMHSGPGTRSLASGAAHSPAEVLRRLNVRLFEAQGEQARFATAVYGTINTRTRAVRLAGAGHPLPLVVCRHRATSIETNGPLLGVFDDADFDEAEFTLEDGQSLLVYTDGLEASLEPPTQERTAPRGSHIQQLLETVRNTEAGASLPARLSGLIDHQFGSLHQQDDVTVLAITALARAAAARRAA